ncbi:MAG: hypothetical protein ACOY82_06740 [Pseudomonadota bacterium]
MPAHLFAIDPAHPALPGHFPGRPVVPGVLILDRVLDAIETTSGPLGALRWPQTKFLQPLLPGESARIEVDALACDPAVGDAATRRWRFRVSRDETTIASGEVVAE